MNLYAILPYFYLYICNFLYIDIKVRMYMSVCVFTTKIRCVSVDTQFQNY
jgi:hypothetical protein